MRLALAAETGTWRPGGAITLFLYILVKISWFKGCTYKCLLYLFHHRDQSEMNTFRYTEHIMTKEKNKVDIFFCQVRYRSIVEL